MGIIIKLSSITHISLARISNNENKITHETDLTSSRSTFLINTYRVIFNQQGTFFCKSQTFTAHQFYISNHLCKVKPFLDPEWSDGSHVDFNLLVPDDSSWLLSEEVNLCADVTEQDSKNWRYTPCSVKQHSICKKAIGKLSD